MFTIRFRKKKKSDIPPPCTCGKNCNRGRERAGTFCVLGTILIDIVRDTEESTMEIKKMLLLPVDHFDETTGTELPLIPSEKFSTCKCIEGVEVANTLSKSLVRFSRQLMSVPKRIRRELIYFFLKKLMHNYDLLVCSKDDLGPATLHTSEG